MTEFGIKLGFVLNDKHTYEKYLLSKGFTQCKEPRDCNNRKILIKDWMKQNQIYPGNHKTVIVCGAGSHHICCIKDGKVRDIWNSSTQKMHKYWWRKA